MMNDYERSSTSYQFNDPKSLHQEYKIRAAELFKMCDIEDKGFINKKDIQRMREPMNLSPEMLEEVFDSLDYDKNGYLTLEEFTAGFFSFCESQEEDYDDSYTNNNSSSTNNHSQHASVSSKKRHNSNAIANIMMSNYDEDIHELNNDQEDDAVFHETMDSLGASGLIEQDSRIKDLWLRLRHQDPNMQKTFEDFIGIMCHEIKKSKTDNTMLESVLQSKASMYDEHVRKLYEEMEAQMKAENARVVALEKQREKELKERLDMNLREKERQLQESLVIQKEMEQKLYQLNLLEYQQKQENERLLRENEMLGEQLQEYARNLQDSKSYISTLQQQTKEDKRNRAKQALKVTESVAMERENLVVELELLKTKNKKLQDERDELQLQQSASSNPVADEPLNEKLDRSLSKQDSILSRYLRPNSLSIEVDDSFNPVQLVTAAGSSASIAPNLYTANTSSSHISALAVPTNYSDDESVFPEQHLHQRRLHHSQQNNNEISYMKREQPVGANAISQYTDIMNVPPNATPDRVFKIVFIGDSGVGKTSFVQRFCNDSFRDSFSTTIGVDFQVKSIIIDNRVIALQLWDTAGQERYRSITKQYFRKADGVICMYDVTSEQSFKSLRNWISSMRESASEECVLTIIGNKIDLCENDDSRVVKYKDGATLADEHGSLFFETSSKESKYVIETMEAIARILQEREDKQIDDVLNLRVKEKKKGCCS